MMTCFISQPIAMIQLCLTHTDSHTSRLQGSGNGHTFGHIRKMMLNVDKENE